MAIEIVDWLIYPWKIWWCLPEGTPGRWGLCPITREPLRLPGDIPSPWTQVFSAPLCFFGVISHEYIAALNIYIYIIYIYIISIYKTWWSFRSPFLCFFLTIDKLKGTLFFEKNLPAPIFSARNWVWTSRSSSIRGESNVAAKRVAPSHFFGWGNDRPGVNGCKWM